MCFLDSLEISRLWLAGASIGSDTRANNRWAEEKRTFGVAYKRARDSTAGSL